MARVWWIWLLWWGCAGKRVAVTDPQCELELLGAREHVRQLEVRLGESGVGTTDNVIFPELKQVFSGSEVVVSREGGATKLILRASHVFSDVFTLKHRTEANSSVDLLATAIGRHPEYAVLIVGHTSDRPLTKSSRFTSHTDWSIRMATALSERLVSEFKADPSQFTVAGRGQYSPLESNDVESGRDANQRLEIWIYPPNVPLPPPNVPSPQ